MHALMSRKQYQVELLQIWLSVEALALVTGMLKRLPWLQADEVLVWMLGVGGKVAAVKILSQSSAMIHLHEEDLACLLEGSDAQLTAQVLGLHAKSR